MADKHASGSLDINDLFGVKGFKCLVTGGATGIGLMVTQGLVKNGATVYITGRRKDRLDKVVETYSTGEGKIIGIACDITDKTQISSLADQISKSEPNGLDLVVNNAGVAPEDHTREKQPENNQDVAAMTKWLNSSTPDEWQSTLMTNVMGQYFVAVAMLPLLAKGSKNRPGHSPTVINITSVAGVVKISDMGQFAYSTSKAAAIHLTRQLASVFAPLRVRVNSIAPGVFPSEMTAHEPADEDTMKSHLPQEERSWPAKRVGDEGDIVATTIWMASPGGVFLNGQIVYLDGGLTVVLPSAA